LTDDVKVFKEKIAKVKASGGSDAPEDIRGGLKKVFDIHFKSNVKIITHIADAPCHGKK